MISSETSSVDLDQETKASENTENKPKDSDSAENKNKVQSQQQQLSDEEAKDFCTWMTSTLGPKVKEVKITKRLSDSPAIVTDHESGALRRMLRMVVSSIRMP